MCQTTSTPKQNYHFIKVQNQNTSSRYAHITKMTTDHIITINHSLLLKTTHRPRIIAVTESLRTLNAKLGLQRTSETAGKRIEVQVA